jgi:enoyl reductase-like protein
MVAGMTPTTVNAQFVAACTDAGYHVELAGGGHLSRESLKTEIEEVLESTPHGWCSALAVAVS